VKMDFLGARKDVAPEGLEKTGAVFSYFKGRREDWHTGLPGYRRIIYRNLWPGIDMVFKGDVGKLKYEYIVAPEADPSLIRLGIRGAQAVRVDMEGRLVVDTPLEKIIDEKPFVYQENEYGERQPVEAAYKLDKARGGARKLNFRWRTMTAACRSSSTRPLLCTAAISAEMTMKALLASPWTARAAPMSRDIRIPSRQRSLFWWAPT
jgi:hypothetical protein